MIHFDALAFTLLYWSAAAALHRRPGASCWRDVAVLSALVVAQALTLCGALGTLVSPSPLPAWCRAVLYLAAAAAAIVFYRRRKEAKT